MTAQRTTTTTRHKTIVAGTVMTLLADSASLPVNAELEYHTRDPFAVRIVFSIPSSPAVEWVFARDLLAQGLNGPAGAGDVQVFPVRGGVMVELDSPAGSARLLVREGDLARFVENMLKAVPLEQEHDYYDIDLEIALLSRTETPGQAQR